MAQFFVLLFSVLFSLNSFADISTFTGIWRGKGQVVYKGQAYDSDFATVEFKFTDDIVSYQDKFSFEISGVRYNLLSNLFNIKVVDNEFYVNGEKVGSLQGNVISSDYTDTKGNRNVMLLMLVGEQMILSKKLTQANGDIIEESATLEKKN